MKHKKLIGMALATGLALSSTTSALATNGGVIPGGGGGVPPTADEIAANGNTTISIMETKVNPKNVSFTIPLYLTMAVVNNDAMVAMPDNYTITNTTPESAGATGDTKIGITAMSFEKLNGSTYDTIAYTAGAITATEKTKLMLTIGGVDMPALNAPSVAPVDLTTTSQRSGAQNQFWDAAGGGKPKPIAVGAPVTLKLDGTVAKANDRTAAQAVAQFRVKYTISLLDDQNNPLGWVYAGNDRTQAGLKPFTTQP